LILLIGLFPIATFAVPVLIFIIQAYYAGFGNFDYYLERYANVSQSKYFVSRNKGLAVGNGAVFLALLLIPIAGLFLAPALATTAATVEGIKRRDQLN
jgi:CysZ protein